MYNHREIEQKWQRYWEENNIFKTEKTDPESSSGGQKVKPKYYCLDMFPYPSGAGLHVGHPEGYTANDIIARYKKANGFNVLHPMGWDAFGLPAENYAIKTGTHPRITTDKNIQTFKNQIKSLGFSYDRDREIDTTDPDYYKWTQWIFLKLFEKGLAYEQDLPINYCPSCKTGLANEEVLNDFTCERCGSKVEKKKIRQWVLAITKYADRLIKDVDRLDWPESIKEMQRNWIGKSEGCEFEMKLAQKNEACISKNGIGLNCPAKASLDTSILKDFIKVKKKTHFLNKIEGLIINQDKKIIFNSGNILKHFKSKNTKEFHYRRNLLGTVFYNINKIDFDSKNHGHVIYKNKVIKIVLGKQSNSNYFVKTFYINDKLTEILHQKNNSKSISVYTTRIDTVFGMTYAVLAPDHPKVKDFIIPEHEKECLKYVEEAKKKSDQDRTADNKEKTGVFTGSYVINPFNGEKVPLWIADYVLGNYGTGAVMAVPAHDERDFEFAKKYGLEIKQSIGSKIYLHEDEDNGIKAELHETGYYIYQNIAYTKYGTLVNSGEFSGLTSEEAKIKLTKFAEKNGFGEKKVNYKLRDWLFSRQRYWGEPIPLIHLNEDDLKRLSIITKKEFEELQEGVLDLINKKMRVAPLQAESGTPKGTTALLSYIDIILNDTKKVKEKRKKSFKLNEVFEKKYNNTKEIRISGKYLILHFQEKVGFEKVKRYRFAQTIISNLEKVNFISETFGLLNISGKYWIIVLEKNSDGSFNLVTYYNFKSLNNLLKTAYIKEIPSSYTVIERSLSSEDIDKLKDFGNLEILKETKDRGRFFKVEISLEKEESFIDFLKDALITRSKNDGGNWYADSMGTTNKIVFNSKVFDIKFKKDLKAFKEYGLSVGVRESELDIDFVEGSSGEYLVIGGRVFSRIYDGLYEKMVCDYNLPLKLPEVKEYEPSGDGNSPLAKIDSFVNVKLADNLIGKRETNTMPQWGGSCWYYLRFMDPKNNDELVSKEAVNYWEEVDSYVGGAEHAVLHLLYARFWHKFLFDIGVVPTDEPFYRLRNQGLILSYAFQRKNGGLVANDEVEEKDGKFYEKSTGEELNQIISKMSKSLKNVINPDDIINEYGADSLRLYEMYMADFKDSAPWDSKNIIGVRRFLDRIYSIYTGELEKYSEDDNLSMKMLHKTIKKVGEDIENYKFNTSIAQMMICINEGMPKENSLQKEWKEAFLILLHPFAPHLSEELWKLLGKGNSIFFADWPEYNENLVVDDTITIGVQVLGKLRGEIEIGIDEDKESVLKKAKENTLVKKWIDGKVIVKEIYVPGKIVNLVIKGDDIKKDKIINNDKKNMETNIKKEYKKTDYKFVAILNKKIEVGKVMNALAHMTAGMVGNSKSLEEMGFINYEDKDNSPHLASKHPFIILKAKNSNEIRGIRNQVIEKGLEFSSFTSAMTVGSYEDQLEESKKQGAEDLEYYGLSIFGKKEIVDEITKKLSLWV